jgi:hypothetical protein
MGTISYLTQIEVSSAAAVCQHPTKPTGRGNRHRWFRAYHPLDSNSCNTHTVGVLVLWRSTASQQVAGLGRE